MLRYLVILTLCYATQVHARDWYVDNVTGDNRWDGKTGKRQGETFGPLREIRMALHRATAGDRIVLVKNDEPYRECISLVGNKHSGTVLQPFIIEGNNAILDGSQATAEFDWQALGGDLYRLPLSESASQILFLEGIPALRAPAFGPLREKKTCPRWLGVWKRVHWSFAPNVTSYRSITNRRSPSIPPASRSTKSTT